jgi:hypothetical protein
MVSDLQSAARMLETLCSSPPARTLRLLRRSWWAAPLAFILGACQGPSTAPTSNEPAISATDVKAQIDATYRHRDLHVLLVSSRSVSRPEDKTLIWTRQYDGVDLATDARSVLVGGHWETRWLRELSEPEPVRRAELWSFAAAAHSVGLDAGLARGTVHARLIYRPELQQLFKVAKPENAADVEMVVKSYRLAIELVDDEAKNDTYVDAYTGERITQVSQWVNTALSVRATNYGIVSIDATRRLTVPPQPVAYTYQDPNRVSLQTFAGASLNGQGVVGGMPTDANSPLAYYTVSTALAVPSYNNDIAWALRGSWDYYLAAFGRRGLRNLVPSPTAFANDAIAYYNPGASPNLGMHSETGLIEVDGASGWQTLATLDGVAHEWSHAVWAADTAHGDHSYYWGANGGLNEANSDLFGELVEARTLFQAGKQSDDHIQDNWVMWQSSTTYNRKMCTPSASLVPPGQVPLDEWSSKIDDPAQNVDPHVALGPIVRVFCLLGRGMVKNGSANDPELQSPITPDGFAALGDHTVGDIEYRSLSRLRGFPVPASFMDQRFAMISAATDLYGEYSPAYKAVEDAFAVIKVGLPADRTPPVITLASSAVLKPSVPIEVTVTSANPIVGVSFAIDNIALGTVAAAPWEVTPPSLPEGNHTLTVTAVDAHKNTATSNFTVTYDATGPAVTFTDVTPCTPGAWCGAYQHKRLYRVDATDFSGVSQVLLYVDGPPVGAASGASNVFTVSYLYGGDHTLQARAVDNAGNVGASPLQTFNVDMTPPFFSYGPVYNTDPAIEGRVWFDFCATDPAGMGGWQLEIDGVAHATNATVVSQNCWNVRADAVAVGAHSYVLHVVDNWNNDAATSGQFTLAAIPPTLALPAVMADSAYIGHATVSTSYSATHGIGGVTLRICDGGGCVTNTVWTPTNSAADQSGHVFNVYNLIAGHVYWAQVAVTGYNGATTTRNSSTFTIPNATVPTFNEVERNDQINNSIPSSTRQIKGTFNGTTLAGFSGYWDYDGFAISVPAGKTLDVASAFNCAYTELQLLEWDPVEGSWLPLSGQAANGAVSMSSAAWPSSVAANTTFEIGVNFDYGTLSGWASPSVPGCGSPSYTINLSVH